MSKSRKHLVVFRIMKDDNCIARLYSMENTVRKYNSLKENNPKENIYLIIDNYKYCFRRHKTIKGDVISMPYLFNILDKGLYDLTGIC